MIVNPWNGVSLSLSQDVLGEPLALELRVIYRLTGVRTGLHEVPVKVSNPSTKGLLGVILLSK